MAPLVPLFYFLDEGVVDQTLQALEDAGHLPERALVFGSHAHRLGALELQWRHSVELAIALVPGDCSDLQDAVLLVVENEVPDLGRVVWVHGSSVEMPAPAAAYAIVHSNDCTVPELSARIGRIMGMA